MSEIPETPENSLYIAVNGSRVFSEDRDSPYIAYTETAEIKGLPDALDRAAVPGRVRSCLAELSRFYRKAVDENLIVVVSIY